MQSGSRGSKRTQTETPNSEPQQYSRNVIGTQGIWTGIFLLYSWGSLFGVPTSIFSGLLASFFLVVGIGGIYVEFTAAIGDYRGYIRFRV